MTDAKELAARLRALADEAADTLEAQADLIDKLRRVVETNVMGKPLEGEGLAWAEATVLQQQAEEIRALSRAAAGGE